VYNATALFSPKFPRGYSSYGLYWRAGDGFLLQAKLQQHYALQASCLLSPALLPRLPWLLCSRCATLAYAGLRLPTNTSDATKPATQALPPPHLNDIPSPLVGAGAFCPPPTTYDGPKARWTKRLIHLSGFSRNTGRLYTPSGHAGMARMPPLTTRMRATAAATCRAHHYLPSARLRATPAFALLNLPRGGQLACRCHLRYGRSSFSLPKAFLATPVNLPVWDRMENTRTYARLHHTPHTAFLQILGRLRWAFLTAVSGFLPLHATHALLNRRRRDRRCGP